MARPWHQRPGEPDAAYNRFLIYRNLGPGRSVLDAYRSTLRGNGTGAGKGRKKQRIPGQWGEDCAAFHWVARATSWDRAMLARHGRQAVIAFVQALCDAATKTVRVITELKGPQDWSQVIETVNTLGSHIDPETIKVLFAHPRRRARRAEANGRPPG
jgi:hypothetical protein